VRAVHAFSRSRDALLPFIAHLRHCILPAISLGLFIAIAFTIAMHFPFSSLLSKFSAITKPFV
jgi:hypothetical protein